MNSEKRWIGILSALLLLLGIFVGIAMDRFLFRPPSPPASAPLAGAPETGRRLGAAPRMFLQRLVSELDLTDEQRERVEQVFRRNLPRLRAARGDRERFRAVRRQMREELDGVLTPQQRAKLEELKQRERGVQRGRAGERPEGPDLRGGGE